MDMLVFCASQQIVPYLGCNRSKFNLLLKIRVFWNVM